MDVVQQNRICFLLTLAVCCVLSVIHVEASADTYLGCYDEFASTSVFSHESKRITLSRLTPDGCRAGCRNNTFSFAGLWGGSFCYCAAELKEGEIRPVNSLLCNSTCPEEPSEACGGSNGSYLYSVYSVCQKGLYGEDCTNDCNCKDNKSCSVTGICPGDICTTGWKLNDTNPNIKRCSIEINECRVACNSTSDSDCHNCKSVQHEKCRNTNGSFECVCIKGYNKKRNGTCEDNDECRGSAYNNCSQYCNNTEGSYNCSCASGYELEGRFACKDIDECEKKTSECEQTCANTNGSYTCGCNEGFRPNTTNRFKCDDINECAENQFSCTHNCTNTVGSYNCSCRIGYQLDNNGYTCNDIDECQTKTSLCEQKCQNTEGSYICDCNSGFRLNSSSRFKCDDINECIERTANCGQTCNNMIGSYTCSCETGYELDSDRHKCNDIDECFGNTSRCNQECKNTKGSYECRCKDGFELLSDKHQCQDIDECQRNMSKCNQNCRNTIGRYNCSCYVGYQLENEFNCIDINECFDNNGGCQHYCNNTVGSFVCSCRPGYKIATKIEEHYNCTDIDECTEGNSGCQHECNNTLGGYNCSCHSGFQLHEDRHQCNDVDECAAKTHKCSQNCKNEYGNYSCSCTPGYYKVGDFDCSKELLGMILGVVIFILIIWIVIIAIIILKVKRLFPFDKPRSFNNFWKRKQDTALYENGTRELTGLKETPVKSNLSPAVTTETALKKFKKTCIAVKDLKKYIEKINSSSGFEEEFKSIPMVSDLSYEFAQYQALKSKNRFKNILPYDENRVVLDEVNDDPLTTYINASFIKGYSPQDKIIASHGPTPNTVDDFWRMLWQYEVSVIVMVTKCLEDAKRKCEQYWPLEGSVESGDLTISHVSTEKWPDYIITRLKVIKESKSRLLVHLLFTTWPDHGVPDHATSLLSFRRAARNVIVANKFFLVHCSAGVGRTGTFLAIDFLLQQAKDKGSVDVYKYLQGLRDQRMNAVQTLDQYEFIHQALLEALTLGETAVSCSALTEHRKHLKSLNPLTGKTFIQTEFDMLQEMHPPLSAEEASVALAKDNVSRNRDTRLVPADVNRVILRETETGNDYINAVFVSSYRLKDAFISAELPLNETLVDFWTMVLNNESKVIAFLDTSGASDDLNNRLLVPTKTKLLVARHKVWTHSFKPTKLSDHCSSYFVAVYNPPDDDEDVYANAEDIPSFKVLVLHFHLTGRLAELLPQVNEQIKTSSQNIKDNGPVVIVSRDGVNPSGQYIAVSNLLEMATSQHEVDVFNAVHNIKKTQPYFITSLDEYQMIFDALEAEGDMSTYANF